MHVFKGQVQLLVLCLDDKPDGDPSVRDGEETGGGGEDGGGLGEVDEVD